MIKDIIKKVVGKLGYIVRSTKYIPSQFIENKNVLKLNFDHIISSYLVNKKDKDQFFFIQVGAYDGIECDPVYKYIIKYSWSGIMLEPQPNAFEKLSRLHEGRPNLKLVNAALSRKREKSTFYILEGKALPSWAQGMASFDRQNILKHQSVIPDIENHLKETEIECITFKDLFSRFDVTHVDLLQIDTEGFDAEVIYMFPFENIKPSIIHFESKHLLKPELEKLLAYLISLDYSVAYDGEEDMLAVYNISAR